MSHPPGPERSPQSIRVVPCVPGAAPPTQEEAEARLHQEGYDSLKWYDVPGASYPSHRHAQDECLWILKGEIVLEIAGAKYELQSGDRIYLPARTPHTARVPGSRSVTYLIGQRP